MIARITRHKNGIVEYLKKGIRADSNYTRQDKDNVICIYGNINTLDKSIKYLNDNKNYKDNYLHITLSFSKDDINKLDNMSEKEREQTLKDITELYIKHHTKGYNLENEVIAYAEIHKPKIKKNEKGYERLEHIHIVISNQNALNNTRLRTTFANTFIDDTLQSYVNNLYGFDNPKEHKKIDKNIITKKSELRAYFKDKLKDIKNHDELIKYFEVNKLNYKEVKTKRNHYYKLVDYNINLRGRDFKHLETLTANKNYTYPHTQTTQELAKILNNYYEKRINEISKRRSKKDTKKLNDILNNNKQEQTKETSISIDETKKAILYEHYKNKINFDLLGYRTFIDEYTKQVRFFNEKDNIEIKDNNKTLFVNFKECKDKEKAVNNMLDLALAKGWKLDKLNVRGSDDFKKEVYKQIKQRLEQEQEQRKKAEQEKAEKQKRKLLNERAETPTQQVVKDNFNEKYINAFNNELLINKDNKDIYKDIKNNIDINKVLKYAQEHYKINLNDYEPSENNKINNKTNKQKPKSVIDFFNKELGLTLSESMQILTKIYKEQLQEQQNQKNIKEIKQDLINNLPKQTKITNEINNKGKRMFLSICKDENPNALNKWEQVEIKNYNDIIKAITTYPYSVAVYKSGYRNSDNVESFNNVLIYDIDNDINKPYLSIEQAKDLLNENNINGLIINSKSHNIEKNGHKAERFRIIIPLQNPLQNTDKEIYRETQKIISDKLGLNKYADTKALNDKARFYYKTPLNNNLEYHIIKNNDYLNIAECEKQAINKINYLRELRQTTDNLRTNETKINDNLLSKYKNQDLRNYVNIIDYQEILKNVDIKELIKHFEPLKSEPYSDSENYLYYKTDKAVYSIISNNVIYDFKSEQTYNNITYLEKMLNTNNLTTINNFLKNNNMGDYSKLNDDEIYKIINNNMDNLYNVNDIKNKISEYFKINKITITQEPTIKIKIFDKDLDLGLENTKIINDNINNNIQERKAKQEREKQERENKRSFGMRM